MSRDRRSINDDAWTVSLDDERRPA